MSISFVRAKAISRSTGQSAVACSAYRACEKMQDEHHKKTQDYTKKGGLIASGFESPANVKMDREKLWNLVERFENRKDARLAKEFIVALPHEFSKEIHIQIAQEIAKQLSKENRFADWAIHEPSKKGDDRNTHAHFLITDRGWDKESGTFEKKKNREWNTEAYLQKQKEAIAEICNVKLREMNLPEIDPRRYTEKLEAGLDVKEPQKHLSLAVYNLGRKQAYKLNRLQKEITQLEGLQYGNTRGSSGLDRLDGSRSSESEKSDGTAQQSKTRDTRDSKERDSSDGYER